MDQRVHWMMSVQQASCEELGIPYEALDGALVLSGLDVVVIIELVQPSWEQTSVETTTVFQDSVLDVVVPKTVVSEGLGGVLDGTLDTPQLLKDEDPEGAGAIEEGVLVSLLPPGPLDPPALGLN